MHWKWSEYPLENQFSAASFLFGNDDEFSTLEHTQQITTFAQQNKHQSDGVITKWIRDAKSIWNHPK